jgi:hypothetical protein
MDVWMLVKTGYPNNWMVSTHTHKVDWLLVCCWLLGQLSRQKVTQ